MGRDRQERVTKAQSSRNFMRGIDIGCEETPASHSCSESCEGLRVRPLQSRPLPAFQGALQLDWRSFLPHPLPHPTVWWA